MISSSWMRRLRLASMLESGRCAGIVTMMAAVAWSALAIPSAQATHSIPSRNLELVGHFNNFPPNSAGTRYSSCWHYVHEDGREYAVIGHQRGVGIYNVTNPHAAYLVDSIPGSQSGWREMKSYRNWIYVVNETGSGLQIIRMTDPENPVVASNYTLTFQTAHTVTIDTTRALLFANGTKSSGQAAGMRVLSLANPEAPVELGRYPNDPLPIQSGYYVHDAVVRGTTLYASAIYGGGIRVLDTSNPANVFESVNFGYFDSQLPHNSWPDASGQYLYVTDETNGMPLSVFDISNYDTPFKLPVYEWTSNPQAVVHNAHVNGNDLWLAHYTEGIYVLDATDPRHPAAFGNADTYPGPTGGYKGCWGVDPYFPSGLAIASDMSSGLYLFQVNRNYGIVRVEVTDATTSEPMDEVMVTCTTQGDSLETPFYGDGIVAFAPNPGSHTFQVRQFGYETATQTVNVTPGSTQTISFALVAKPTANLSGVVRDATNQALLADAQVDLAYSPVHAHASGGSYMLMDVPDDLYRVTVRRPGYIPITFVRRIGPGFDGAQDFQLQPARSYDNLSTGTGWSVPPPAAGQSNIAASGRWMRVEPYGTYNGYPDSPAPNIARKRVADMASIKPPIRPYHEDHEGNGATLGQAQPEVDRSPVDDQCFVTGNLNGPPHSIIDNADVDTTTQLTSAAYDLTGMTTPMIGVWMWFYSQFRHPDDYLAVLISNNNGTSWVPMDTLRGLRNHWSEYDYAVGNYVTPTNQVRLRFVAVDGGEPSVVECAVDDVAVYDGASIPVGILEGDSPSALQFRAVWPNPAQGDVRFVLASPTPGRVDVDVIDVAGRHVRSLHRGFAKAGTLTMRWDGKGDGDRIAPAGLYFVRARTESGVTESRFVRIP